MRRVLSEARPDWQARVEAKGLVYHTGERGRPYWNETAFYEFNADEIDTLEAATNELHRCCMLAAQQVIEHDLLAEMGIPSEARALIRQSWEHQERSIYGRFDLAFDGSGVPKMLEYNGDTPTTIVEGAIAQWYWLEDKFPGSDQFNSVWEGLVEAWQALRTDGALRGECLYFTSLNNPEDRMTVTAMRDTAEEAGIATEEIAINAIGWDTARGAFVDQRNQVMRSIFKLYPWEWILRDQFGKNALNTYNDVQWIEPLWKFVLSSKGLLPVLWRLFPGHPNLLASYADGPCGLARYVAKPVISREGANITVHTPEGETDTEGRYGDYSRVYQELCPLPNFEGNHPVIGSWVIGGMSRGIGIRESDGLITDNSSRFVPHLIGK